MKKKETKLSFVYTNRTWKIRLTTTIHLTLIMTSARIDETSVRTVLLRPDPDDQVKLFHVTPGFKPFAEDFSIRFTMNKLFEKIHV